MSRSRDHGPESRHYKSEIRRLKKQLRQYEKMAHILEERLDEDPEPILKEIKNKKGTCPQCDEGKVQNMDLGIVKYHVCNSCSYRKKIE